MENKFNVLDPVLVYATIDAINNKDGKLVYSLKLVDCDGDSSYVDFIPEESIQSVF